MDSIQESEAVYFFPLKFKVFNTPSVARACSIVPQQGVKQSHKTGVPLLHFAKKKKKKKKKGGRTRNSSLTCSNVVPNKATFEYSYSVSFIRRKSMNRAMW